MIEDNEVIVLVVATGVLLVLWVNRAAMRHIPSVNLLASAYGVFYASWCLTVLEGWFWPEGLNLLEHAAGAGAAVLFAWWCSRLVRIDRGARR